MQAKKQLSYDFIGALLLCGFTLGLLALLQRDFWLVLFPDDGFYYLRIAQNIAQGRGSTFDGINPTNGYHPLWMIILTILAKLFQSPISLAIAVVVVGVLLTAGGFAILAKVFYSQFQHRWGLWLAGAVVFLNPVLVSVFINGMESSLYFFLLSLGFWLVLKNWGQEDFFHWFGLGAFFGLVFLSRLDGGLLAVWIVVFILLRDKNWRKNLKLAIAFALGGILLGAPYLIYNQIFLGHPVPISGRIKAYFRSRDIIYLSILSLGFLASLVGVFIYYYRSKEKLGIFSRVLLIYLAFSFSIIFYYFLSPTYALSLWYYIPLLILFFFLPAGIILKLSTRSRVLFSSLVLVVGLVLALGGYYLYLSSSATSIFKLHRQTIDWIKRHIPKESLLGAYSAGYIVYFTERDTVNLDGLVNSPEYFFKYRIQGKRDEFIKKIGIDYILMYQYLEKKEDKPRIIFNFPVKKIYQQKVFYRGPGTFFRPSWIVFFILQTPFCDHLPVQ